MLAAGAGVGLALVAAGVFVVLGFIHFANRRGGGNATPWAAQAGPVAEVAGHVPQPQPQQQQQQLQPQKPRALHVRDAGERRGMPRATLVRPVVLHRGRGLHRTPSQRTFSLDLGTGGALVAGPADLSLGEELDLVLDIGESGLGAHATVVRETAEGLKGLRFERMTPEDLDRLERYVTGV